MAGWWGRWRDGEAGAGERRVCTLALTTACTTTTCPPLPVQPPVGDASVKLEVGIEDCLHIEFEYDRTRYALPADVVTGRVYFLLVRIRIKYMEVAVIRRESSGAREWWRFGGRLVVARAGGGGGVRAAVRCSRARLLTHSAWRGATSGASGVRDARTSVRRLPRSPPHAAAHPLPLPLPRPLPQPARPRAARARP